MVNLTPPPDLGTDKVIQGIIDLISKEGLVDSYFKIYEKNIENRNWQVPYAQLYLSLEKFIVENKTPIVKSSFTRDSLRRVLFESIGEESIQPIIAPLFLSQEKKLREILRVSFDSLISCSPVDLNYDPFILHVKSDFSDINDYFQNLYADFYIRTKEKIGETRVEELFNKLYEEINNLYDSDTVQLVLGVIGMDNLRIAVAGRIKDKNSPPLDVVRND